LDPQGSQARICAVSAALAFQPADLCVLLCVDPDQSCLCCSFLRRQVQRQTIARSSGNVLNRLPCAVAPGKFTIAELCSTFNTSTSSETDRCRTGNLVFISGQLPMEGGKIAATGKVAERVLAADRFLESECLTASSPLSENPLLARGGSAERSTAWILRTKPLGCARSISSRRRRRRAEETSRAWSRLPSALRDKTDTARG
jgi:hypothetical protein